MRRILLIADVLVLWVLPLSHSRAAATAPNSTQPLRSAMPSPGCGSSSQPVGVDITSTLSYGGLTRTYIIHLPTTYSITSALPLVINLPGGGMTAALQALFTHFSLTADRTSVIVVYPQGAIGIDGKTTGFNIFGASDPNEATWNWRQVDDVGFLTALVTLLESQYCIDENRITVAGFSLGAGMAYHLACAGTPWIAALAPIAGTIPANTCAVTHPIALLAVNGFDDPVVPYYLMKIPTIIQLWAQALKCGPPLISQVTIDVLRTAYGGCRNNADTVLYSPMDGGHAWPGGLPVPAALGYTTPTIDTSALIAQFAISHTLPAAS